jgi:hypothetical protein
VKPSDFIRRPRFSGVRCGIFKQSRAAGALLAENYFVPLQNY